MVKYSPRELHAMGGRKLLSHINRYKNFGIKIPDMLNKITLEISGTSYETIKKLAEQSNQ